MPPPLLPAELPEIVPLVIVTAPVPLLKMPPPYAAELPEIVLSVIIAVPERLEMPPPPSPNELPASYPRSCCW